MPVTPVPSHALPALCARCRRRCVGGWGCSGHTLTLMRRLRHPRPPCPKPPPRPLLVRCASAALLLLPPHACVTSLSTALCPILSMQGTAGVHRPLPRPGTSISRPAAARCTAWAASRPAPWGRPAAPGPCVGRMARGASLEPAPPVWHGMA